MKTNELIGPALDWAVAKCGGLALDFQGVGASAFLTTDQIVVMADWDDASEWSPSTNWAQGGPIIEREKIECLFESNWYVDAPHGWFEGGTPLIAAMRCYVASKLGGEVDIPGELS